MHGHLGAVAHQSALGRCPDFPVLDPRSSSFDLRLISQLDNLHGLGQGVNLFLTFDVADFREYGSRVKQFGIGKGFTDLLPGTVENDPLGGSRSLNFSKARDPNTATLNVELS